MREAWCPRSTEPARSDGPGERRDHMHPGMFYWWKNRQGWGGDERAWAGGGGGGCGPRHAGHGEGSERGGGWWAAGDGGEGWGGGAFGVRRPLRFLAYKLELDERQVGELAKGL